MVLKGEARRIATFDLPWQIRATRGGYTPGLHQSFWFAVRPCFTGLSRSRFIMAEREGFSSRLKNPKQHYNTKIRRRLPSGGDRGRPSAARANLGADAFEFAQRFDVPPSLLSDLAPSALVDRSACEISHSASCRHRRSCSLRTSLLRPYVQVSQNLSRTPTVMNA